MCLTKVYYNTYADGAQDITEKSYPCRDGRRCSHPEERRYDRKFPFAKLGDAQPESHRSLSERQPTPYFSGHTRRGSKSPSPSGRGRRHSDAYVTGTGTGTNSYDYRDLYGGYDPYGGYSRHHSSSSTRHDPRDRDRHGRSDHREPRLKRSSTAPHIVYMDREGGGGGKSSSRSRSHSSSRDYSRDIPLGLVPLADEYGRRRRHSHSSPSSSRSHSREEGGSGSRSSSSRDRHAAALADDYYRSSRTSRHNHDPTTSGGYVLVNDADERRRQRRDHDKKHRRLSTSSYPDVSASTSAAAAYDDYTRYMPRRAATTVVHNHHSTGTGGDGSSSGSGSGSAGAKPKQLRWEDQVRAKRERQNAEIASRQGGGDVVKGILKHGGGESKKGKGGSSGSSKGKGREVDEVDDLRRAVERMEIPRGRDRAPRGGSGGDGAGWDGGMGWATYGEDLGRERRKRAKVYADGYRY